MTRRTGGRADGRADRAVPAVGGLIACVVLVAAAARRPPDRPSARPPQACPAPRPTLWAAVRDTVWPLVVHREGDQHWAHLEAARLPGQSATWCNPLQTSPDALAAGRDAYREFCASCHGDTGAGDGPGAGASDPPPASFTRPEFAGMREPPGPALLYAIIARGIDGTAMASHSTELRGYERLAVMAWITSLPGDTAIRNSRAWADSLRARRPH